MVIKAADSCGRALLSDEATGPVRTKKRSSSAWLALEAIQFESNRSEEEPLCHLGQSALAAMILWGNRSPASGRAPGWRRTDEPGLDQAPGTAWLTRLGGRDTARAASLNLPNIPLSIVD